ncbi:type IV pilus secretin PilQ [Aurantivibrio plasticivorans]
MLTNYFLKNKAFLKSVVFTLGLFGAAAAYPSNAINDISFAALPGDRFEVRLTFSETPPDVEHYSIEQPARIVVDFPGAESALKEKRYSLSMPNAQSAMVLGGDNRTRLILNLDELSSYSMSTEGGDFVLEVGQSQVLATSDNSTPQAVSDQVQASAAAPAANSSSSATAVNFEGRDSKGITGIDFRRGAEGEGKVVISLSNPNTNIDMAQVRGAIELTFDGAQLPSNLANRYDVADFATPVNYVDAENQRSGAVVRIEAAGEYDYLAYQTDKDYVISIKPLTQKEIDRRDEQFKYTGERLSLNFQDIPIRSVLQIIADITDLNLVTSDTVSGNIALRLDNVPWDQALELVLKTKGLDKRQVGNVLMVAPAAEIAERERQELETLKQLEELAPLRTEYIRIRYANARELFDLFQDGSGGAGGGASSGSEGNSTGSILSERGQAIVDERTNSIILTDTQEKINQFRELVEQIDIPVSQVMIEARIVIANTDFREELGVRWAADGQRLGSNKYEFSGSLEGVATTGDGSGPESLFIDGDGDGVTDDERSLVDSTVVDLGVFNPAGSFAWNVITDNVLLGMELSALESTGNAEIVSQPKVITGDKQEAEIVSGTEIPYQEASASGATSTSFKEAVLKLNVTPQITPDNNIIMDLEISQDSVGEIDLASGIPTIDITQIQTQVLVANGETVVLGGIYQTEQSEGVNKVPFLGDIPYLGRIFRQDVKREQKRELLIFITPRIMAETLVQ